MAKKDSAASASSAGAPKKQRFQRIRQIAQVYKLTAEQDKTTPLAVWGSLVGILAVAIIIGFIIGHPIYVGILGLMIGILVAMFLLARKAESSAYSRIEGQPGAVGAAMSQLTQRRFGRMWSVEQEPVAFDQRTKDLVFRAVGRPGVALVGEGPRPRVDKLLDQEKRRTERLLPGVPVFVVYVGKGEGEVPLPKLSSHLMRMRTAPGSKRKDENGKKIPVKTLSGSEVSTVAKRLRSLGGTKLPIPKGVDPMRARVDRRAMRGR